MKKIDNAILIFLKKILYYIFNKKNKINKL